jgi:hypothetical protein
MLDGVTGGTGLPFALPPALQQLLQQDHLDVRQQAADQQQAHLAQQQQELNPPPTPEEMQQEAALQAMMGSIVGMAVGIASTTPKSGD